MSGADCRVVVTKEKVATCGQITVKAALDIDCCPVLKFDGTHPFARGHIKTEAARDLANALLAYLDAPDAP